MSNEAKPEGAALVLGVVGGVLAAYLGHNTVEPDKVPALIANVIAVFGGATPPDDTKPEKLVPAVSIKKSITPDFMICLEDGKKFKSLKRHLQNQYGLTPAEYREKWGLPKDYPMVAPNYSARRGELARASGLGVGRKPAEGAAA